MTEALRPQPGTAPEVYIYTDGGCDPNPGPGGFGAVLIHPLKRREISGAFRLTTNNRMEIYAAIQALRLLKMPCRVILFSDSQYLVNAMTKGWVERWKKRHWRRSTGERAVNVDLWEQMLVLRQMHQVDFRWLRGHAGYRENERCDQLCSTARRRPDLPADEGYEKMRDSESRKIEQERAQF